MPRPPDPHAREALVAAARVEFSRRGLRGARIEDITAACGLSKGAFYLHFESKEALFGGLVQEFMGAMSCSADEREKKASDHLLRHGPITRRDAERKSAAYLELMALETAEDLRVLEDMWKYRDVMDVLISGCAGTGFEGVMWQMVEAQSARVAANFAERQKTHGCRTDVPPALFASLIVGTYLLIGKQMARSALKPDLAAWARDINKLIREGANPPVATPARAPPPATRRPARARSARRASR